MKNDFEAIEEIRTAAIRQVGDELAFAYPEVLGVIQRCSVGGFAVLGIEVLWPVGDDIYTENLSGYDVPSTKLPLPEEDWKPFVRLNNALAESFVRQHPMSGGYFYILTTASLREFRQIEKTRQDPT